MPHAHDIIGNKAGSNPGLALTRLAPPLTSRAWSEHLLRIVELAAPVGYLDHFRRLRARTAAGASHRRVLLATSLAPVICGMGERTPGENGLSLHPVYGVPFLPGSSLKGILRGWVLSQDWGPDWVEGGTHFRSLFGEGGDHGAAAVIDLLDALPLPDGSLFSLDVLTPHFADYYEGKGAPLGWQGPNPVQFLTAAKGTKFRVVLEGPRGWVDKASEWLALALAERGVGAKSRAGYGRFTCEPLGADHPDERDAAKRNAEARRTRSERAADLLRGHGKDAVRGEIEKWLTGQPVSERLRDVLPGPPESAPAWCLGAVRTLGEEWGLREEWAQRTRNTKADEARKARARSFIEAWDRLLPSSGSPSPAADPASEPTATQPSKFGTATWTEPSRHATPDGVAKVAKGLADRAGGPNAPSEEAVEACLQWLRTHGGKRGQINQVRRAYGLGDEPP